MSKSSEDHANFYEKYDTKNNISEPIMYKYEYTQIIGVRAQQIAEGSEPLIKVTKDLTNEVLIAEEELRQRKTPFILERKITNTHTDYWKIEDLSIDLL